MTPGLSQYPAASAFGVSADVEQRFPRLDLSVVGVDGVPVRLGRITHARRLKMSLVAGTWSPVRYGPWRVWWELST
jgi:hypothetical protein